MLADYLSILEAVMKFSKGDFVIHRLTGDKLMILKIGNEQYQCRTPDYREIYFWEMELEKA